MSLDIAPPSTTPGTRRRTTGHSADRAARPAASRPRLAVVPPEAPVWSATTVPVTLRVATEESEARLRARRAHPAGRGRLTAVPSENVTPLQASVPFDQCAELAPAPAVAVEEPVVAEPTPLRITERGRALLRLGLAVALALVVLAAVLVVGRQAQAGESAGSLPVTYRVVMPGETLWEIAGKVAPGVDRRDTVDRIQELNALSGVSVSAGQRIAVPVSTQS